MTNILVLGDSHLEKCYENALLLHDELQFNNEKLCVSWEYGFNNLESIKTKFSSIKSEETPNVIIILCGSYDMFVSNNPRFVANKMQKIVKPISSSSVSHILVCSILNRLTQKKTDEFRINNSIKLANEQLMKALKVIPKTKFVDIQPAEEWSAIISEDKYHYLHDGYIHIYERLCSVVNEMDFRSSIKPVSVPIKHVHSGIVFVTEVSKKTTSDSLDVDGKVNRFKSELLDDYKRLAEEEWDISTQIKNLKNRLEILCLEKEKVESRFKKLFPEDAHLLKSDLGKK